MASFNKVVLLGNLTRDPDLRVTAGGASICKFGLACSRAFTTADGNRREEVVFVDIDAFGRPAEIIAKYATKGKPLLVEGRLRFDQWESASGERRNKLTIVLETFQFVGARSEGSEEMMGGASYEETASVARAATPAIRANAAPSAPSEPDFDEDVPF